MASDQPDPPLWKQSFKRGAGDGIRTRDIQLGKLMLYQLSYSRLGQRENNVAECSRQRPT